MRALGLLSILLALVIVAVLAKKQMSAAHQAAGASAQAASQAGVEWPKLDSAQDAKRLEGQVQSDVNRMMRERASQVDSGVGEGGEKP
jgi:hypothetical protein